MVDELKYLDGHSDEIHDLIETVPLSQLPDAANAKHYYLKCVAMSLLEWATFAATRAGATAGELTTAVSDGTVMAEEENERMESGFTPDIRH